MLLYALFFLLFCILFSIVVVTYRNGISPMPSQRKAVKAMLELIPSEVNGQVIELGSGWGTLAFAAAKALPHCHITAFENSPVPFLFSKIRQLCQPRKNLIILYRDFYREDLSGSSLIFCYLYPGGMKKLRKKFEEELRPGTWIISNTFAIPGWEPKKTRKIADLYFSTVYLYQI